MSTAITPLILTIAALKRVDPALLQATYIAEGNTDQTFIHAMKTTPPPADITEALRIGANTILHAQNDFLATQDLQAGQDLRAAFVAFLASRWAPPDAPNDPHNLNANWAGNVLTEWRKLRP